MGNGPQQEQSDDEEANLSLIDNEYTDNILKSSFVRMCPTIPENSLVKMYWDGIILLFALWNCFMVPLTLFFRSFREYFYDQDYYICINVIQIVLFFLDIIFQMNTTYYDNDGEEIEDKQKIIKHYLKGMFFIDLLSAIPWEYGP